MLECKSPKIAVEGVFGGEKNVQKTAVGSKIVVFHGKFFVRPECSEIQPIFLKIEPKSTGVQNVSPPPENVGDHVIF